jgi:hypothetical protein
MPATTNNYKMMFLGIIDALPFRKVRIPKMGYGQHELLPWMLKNAFKMSIS